MTRENKIQSMEDQGHGFLTHLAKAEEHARRMSRKLESDWCDGGCIAAAHRMAPGGARGWCARVETGILGPADSLGAIGGVHHQYSSMKSTMWCCT